MPDDASADNPLYLAASRAKPDAVKFLLSLGENSDGRVGEWGTRAEMPPWRRPLMGAAKSGCVLCAEMLLDAGAGGPERVWDPEMSEIRWKPEGIEATEGNKQTESAAEIGLTDAEGYHRYIKSAALHVACKYGNFPVAELLLARGADPHYTDASSVSDDSDDEANMKPYGVTPMVIDRLYQLATADPQPEDSLHRAGIAHDAMVSSGIAVLRRISAAGIDVGGAAGEDVVRLTCVLFAHGGFDVAKTIMRTRPCGRAYGFALYYAARHNWLDIATMLLDNGVLVNFPSCHEKSALFGACEGAHPDMVEFLIARGAKVNTQGDGGITPLHIAARNGDTATLRLLLGAGAKINIPDRSGPLAPRRHRILDGSKGRVAKRAGAYTTALHVACERGDIVNVSVLLEAGGNPSMTDGDGDTPLHGAASLGRADIMSSLIRAGADVNARNYLEDTPLCVACRNLEYFDPNSKSFAGLDALERPAFAGAVLESEAEIVSRPISDDDMDTSESKADDNTSSFNGFVSEKGPSIINGLPSTDRLAPLRLLLENGAFVDSSNMASETPLYFAASSSRTDVIELLLAAGACPDGVPSSQSAVSRSKTPLCAACANSRLGNVRMLLQNGADPNLCEMQTPQILSFPLCIASESGDDDIVIALFSHGASVARSIDGAGRNALHHAVGPTRRVFPFELQRVRKIPQIVRVLLEHGAKPNEPDSHGLSALCSASAALTSWRLRVYGNRVEEDLYARGGMRVDVATYVRLVLPTVRGLVASLVKSIDAMIGCEAVILDDSFVPSIARSTASPTVGEGVGDLVGAILSCTPVGVRLAESFLKAGASCCWLEWITSTHAQNCRAAGDAPTAAAVELCKAAVIAGYKIRFPPSLAMTGSESTGSLTVAAGNPAASSNPGSATAANPGPPGTQGSSAVNPPLQSQPGSTGSFAAKQSVRIPPPGGGRSVAAWLETEGKSVPSLMRVVRIAVRRRLCEVVGRRSVMEGAAALALPEELGAYVVFEGPLCEVRLGIEDEISDGELLSMLRLQHSS